MAYRSPKMENISRDSAGINMSPVGILIEMLEKGHEQHVREASTWASGMETLEKYIGEASSGDSLNELDLLPKHNAEIKPSNLLNLINQI